MCIFPPFLGKNVKLASSVPEIDVRLQNNNFFLFTCDLNVRRQGAKEGTLVRQLPLLWRPTWGMSCHWKMNGCSLQGFLPLGTIFVTLLERSRVGEVPQRWRGRDCYKLSEREMVENFSLALFSRFPYSPGLNNNNSKSRRRHHLCASFSFSALREFIRLGTGCPLFMGTCRLIDSAGLIRGVYLRGFVLRYKPMLVKIPSINHIHEDHIQVLVTGS